MKKSNYSVSSKTTNNSKKWDFHRWNDFIKSFDDIDACVSTHSDTITVGGNKIAVRFNAKEQF